MTDFTTARHRAYYLDSYSRQFQATVLESINTDQGQALVLDRSFFYPESGGQPFDQGRLNGAEVVNVQVRESDHAVLHFLDVPIASINPGDSVEGEIDWARRFDHMQQHTGQHILSRAFVDLFDADTIGFHLGVDNCTIDLNIGALTSAELATAETLANTIIFENRPIEARFVSPAEADALPLRKRPEVASEQIRLIDIDRFDLNACGGTHVSATGAVGLIKITKLEKRKKKLRVTFHCGRRALADYRQHHDVTSALSGMLTTGVDSLVDRVEKLQQDGKQQNKSIKRLKQTLWQETAAAAWAEREIHASSTVVVYPITADPLQSIGDLRGIASALKSHGSSWIMVGYAGKPAHLLVQAPESAEIDLATAQDRLQATLPTEANIQHNPKGRVWQIMIPHIKPADLDPLLAQIRGSIVKPPELG